MCKVLLSGIGSLNNDANNHDEIVQRINSEIDSFFHLLLEHVNANIDKKFDKLPVTQINVTDKAVHIKNSAKDNMEIVRNIQIQYIKKSINHFTNFDSNNASAVEYLLQLACIECLDVYEHIMNNIVADMKAATENRQVNHRQSFPFSNFA